MVTKAVHFELVSDLSASTFLAALRRLAARRGTPRHIYSDNGTNFVKAHRVLSQEYIDLSSVFTDSFFNEISEMQINWHFNAPAWPSAGGLWESSVKSLKYHLRRVVGDQKLTYEEFHTLLSQLEACLNSRPLCALTEDPDDINYLTPSHFLSSGPNLTIYETERDERTRWRLTQKIFTDIWRRWRTEYLVQLSARSKWRIAQRIIKLNDVVIIHDDNLPAGKWALGRVVDLHPGADGHVRVVTLKTKNGFLKRPIIKLSVLPVEQHNEERHEPETSEKNQTSVEPENVKSSKNMKNKTTTCLFSFFLLFFNLFTLVFGSYEISHLNTTKGLYFDKVANMQIIRDEWKIIVYYNMDPYWEGLTALNKYYDSLSKSCENSKDTVLVHCSVILTQLRLGFSELQYYDRMLLDQQFTAYDRRRARRGLFNGGGYILHSLFGVLDDDFAEKYKRDIELVNTNQKHLALLWKNQTSVIEAEYNLLKRMEESMSKQHKTINQRINAVEQATNVITSELQKLDTVNDFILSAIIASNTLSKLSSIQEAIIDIITNVYNGKLNVHLLTPGQLQEELNIIAGQLPRDLSLPVANIQTDLKHIYHLLRVRARMTKSYLIFEVKIPLISRESFEIYNAIPIPQQVGTNAISIIPISEYLAINLQKDTYLPSPDVKECLISETRTYLCTNHGPIYHLKSDHSLCIKHRGQENCLSEKTPCRDMWKKLESTNSYLYFICNQSSIRIICGENISVERISRAGIISMSSDCIIKSEGFTLHPHKELSSTIRVRPEVYIHEPAPINHVINISLSKWDPGNQTDEVQSYLKTIGKEIDQLKTEKGRIEEISYHDVHHYTAIYAVVGVLVAIGVVGAWRSWRRVRRTDLQPASPKCRRRESDCGNSSVISVQYKPGTPGSARFVNKASSPIGRKPNVNNPNIQKDS